MSDEYKIDSHKLQYHPERVAQVVYADEWVDAQKVYPLYVEVSPVGACNHRCTFCAVDYIGYQARRLDPEVLIHAQYDMAAHGVQSIMYAGEGEPLLHPKMNEILEGAHSAMLSTAFTTNGVLLDKLEDISQVDWIKVSLNAGTRESYAKIHGTQEKDWDKVWAALERAVGRKGNCTIGVQSVVLPENYEDMPELARMCGEIGVDYLVLKPYSQHKKSINQMGDEYSPSGLLYLCDKMIGDKVHNTRIISRTETAEQYEQKTPYKTCYSTPMLWAYIMANGDVYGCSAYLLDDRFNYGNLYESHNFSEIWEGEKRELNFYYVRDHLDISECRKNCRMHKCNVYLDDLINQKVKHVNFI